ncbi:DUF3972 domain-containing protein [Hydrogenimonas sp.]
MQQLVKPAEYAKMHGLSRQSVYAKIKRGTLPSRKIDGRYYVIVSETEQPVAEEITAGEETIEQVSLIDEYREILKAKEETIEVLKASIEDLKEANAQITRTLQQEITLLKQAFHEMKAIYRRDYMLAYAHESAEPEEAPAPEAEVVVQEAVVAEGVVGEKEPERSDEKEAKKAKEKDKEKEKKRKAAKKRKQQEEEDCWIPLGDLIQRQKYNYNKAKQVVKRFKKAFKKGDRRIRKQNGIYYISCYDFYEDILD